MIRVRIRKTTNKTSANQTETLRFKVYQALLILFYLFFIQSWEDVFIILLWWPHLIHLPPNSLTVEIVTYIVLSFSFIKPFYLLKFQLAAMALVPKLPVLYEETKNAIFSCIYAWQLWLRLTCFDLPFYQKKGILRFKNEALLA